ncbi:hypothetical protein JO972_09970 [Verrucomicrobiaceae bacterium 5K15]|uniref:Uncharacterized protein n=1 Tax=Oceaniferula flava TaxID=2800421 RepID=A0AAE2VE22_9BACT|nr:hypothetical protein [Oceaniferula flavus]MBK1855284.1 hypothetical protein [Oceaniferula flavus]MBM1136590.1 hypothetical protein [Oceaniferula flavus]
MKRVITAIITGSLIAFLWGFVSWTVLDWHSPASFKNDDAVRQVISDNADTHGVYLLPTPSNDADHAARITQGPFVYATIRPGRLEQPWSMTEPLIYSFAINVLGCLIITISVLRIRATRYISRASVGITMGVFAAISVVLPQWNWFETPGKHLLANALDPIIAYTLAGLVIAAIIKTPKARRIFS